MKDKDGAAIAGSDTFVEAFARGLAVMRAFGSGAPALTISEVAVRAGVTRAGARRLLHTLLALGYARTDGTRFSLTPRVLELGHAYLSSLSMREVAQPVIERLAAQLQEIVGLSVLEGTDIVFVARAELRSPLARGIGLGGRLPAFATSMGRVLLAGMPASDAKKLLSPRSLKPYTSFTLCKPEALARLLARVHKQGYALVSEELELGVCGLAAPIVDAQGRVIAAVNVSTNLARHTKEEMLRRFLPPLLGAVAEISVGLRAGR
ncbi:MAG: helix-turn-helix domain-containing protein [Betaproteobacteria bacterium]|nr:helix-turn-helix domain-containing protein [Betaproteobacteria bacterium]